MTDPSLISLFVRPLNQLRIPYLITGAVASVIYGEPRFTRDIDLVVGLQARDAPCSRTRGQQRTPTYRPSRSSRRRVGARSRATSMSATTRPRCGPTSTCPAMIR
jgi:hypothetical protein